MRNIQGRSYILRYHPFPSEKEKREYIIGEALLRSKMVSEEELATLRNVQLDPPDLAVTTKKFGELTIEITESVPYDRKYIARSTKFIEKLRSYLNELGTKPAKPSNILIHREKFVFPPMRSREIKSIAKQIDSFFKREGFIQNYSIIREIIKSPTTITFVPAQGTFTHPAAYYVNNLFIHDITGFPIDNRATEDAIQHVLQKKKGKSKKADILVIFHGIPAMLGFDKIFDQMKGYLLSHLTHGGIYILGIIQTDVDYWISVNTIREHPVFQQK